MTRNIRAVRNALLATVALLTLGATPAHSAPHETVPGDWLYLSVTSGDAPPRAVDSVRAGEIPMRKTRGRLLFCNLPQGQVRAAKACSELAAAKGDISRLRPRPDTICSMIYAPVTASARGRWAGRQVAYSHTFSNSCVMGAETGSVFAPSD